MLTLVTAEQAEQAIRDDFESDWTDLLAHCITRLHDGLTVHLRNGIVYRDTETPSCELSDRYFTFLY